MPAARRYKKSLIDEIGESIRALPPGEPPEPELSTKEALEKWQKDLRRKINDEHVDIAVIVDMLNAKGFKANAREVRAIVKPKSRKLRSAPSAKGAKSQSIDRSQRTNELPSGARKGAFEVRPDGDDI